MPDFLLGQLTQVPIFVLLNGQVGEATLIEDIEESRDVCDGLETDKARLHLLVRTIWVLYLVNGELNQSEMVACHLVFDKATD